MYPEVRKTIKHYDESGSYEDPPSKERPRVTSPAEDMYIRVTSPRNSSTTATQIRAHINSKTGLVAGTSEHQLFRGAYVNQAFVVTLLQRHHY